MSKKLLQTTSIVSIAIIICIGTWYASKPASVQMRHDKEVTINGELLKLEIAQSPSAITRGLSGRKKMEEDEGMLFIMPNVETQTFWMKEMQFPLDIVFLREGRVVDLVTLQKPSLISIPTHQSKEMADMVLELNAGRATELKLEEGTKTTLNELR